MGTKEAGMKKLFLLVCLSLLSLPSPAQDEPLHGLSKDQVRLLKSLGVSVAVPEYIPDGFSVEKVIATISQRGVGGGPGYRIIYASRARKGFVVESVSGGIGSPEADHVVPVVNPIYGETFVGVYKFDGQKSMAGDWVGDGPYFRVRDTDRRHSEERRYDGGLTVETMAKIHSALRPLR